MEWSIRRNLEAFLRYELAPMEHIWWSGVHERGYKPNPHFKRFLKRHRRDVTFCTMSTPWWTRRLGLGRRKKDRGYVSKYFANRSSVLVATNHDPGLKEIGPVGDEQEHSQPSHGCVGTFFFQNPSGGSGFPKIVDSFEEVPPGKTVWSKALSVVSNSQFRALPNGMNWEDAFGQISRMEELLDRDTTLTNLLYVNFNRPGIGSNGRVTNQARRHLEHHFANYSWVTVGRGIGADYLREMRQHLFCLSPEGNCADPHRTWEALYIGVIPVVQRSAAYSWFADLPILQVDDLFNISEELLVETLHIMSHRKFSFEKMSISFWIDHMDSSLSSSSPGH